MIIYLIRHGETTGDLENRYGGDYEDHLTIDGQNQARNLAEKLSKFNIEKIFYSPRIRAQETVEIVLEKLKCDSEIVNDLRERNAYGILTGMVKEEAKEKYPELVEALKNPRNTITDAEDYEEFKKRALNALKNIADSNYDKIGIITHGGLIHCFFREVIGKELTKLGDCAIIKIDYNNNYKIIEMDGAFF